MTMETPKLLEHRCRGQRTAPGDISCPGEPLGLPTCVPSQGASSGLAALLFLRGNLNTAAKGFQAWERGGHGGSRDLSPAAFCLGTPLTAPRSQRCHHPTGPSTGTEG